MHINFVMQRQLTGFDITTEDKVAALATLEDEKHTTVHKKWKSESGSLKSYCGL